MQRTFGVSPLSLLLLVSDAALVAAGLWLSSLLRPALPFGRELSSAATQVPVAVLGLAEACWLVALAAWGAYDRRKVLRWTQEAWRVFAGACIGTILLAGALYLSFRNLSRLQFAYFFLIAVGLLLTGRALLRIYFRLVGRSRAGSSNRVLIVGAGSLGQRVAAVIREHGRWGYSLVGFADDSSALAAAEVEGARVLGSVDEVSRIVGERRVEEVWVALPPRAYDRLATLVADLERQPVRIKVVPDYFSLALVRAKPEVIGGMPLIGLREPVIEGSPRLLKRVFDLVVGSILTFVAAPLLALVALLIRLEGPGPILIRQQRVGENGRLFGMLKFRTMLAGVERAAAAEAEEGAPPHKRRDDPRVTPWGRFLRRFSLDELPQLFNVLRGDMSLVGPRPELPWLVDRYQPWQRKRFAVPQGLTGWWQINGRSDKPMHLNTEDDLYYVYNYSLWLDILILLRTPLVVLLGKGAF
jgi:exopolysaccharide biosynthesis polyprenyl glycosylphosphotransferase